MEVIFIVFGLIAVGLILFQAKQRNRQIVKFGEIEAGNMNYPKSPEVMEMLKEKESK